MTVDIREILLGSGRRAIKPFLDVVDTIYADDPSYVRPLDQDMRERLDPKKNPFFEHGDATLFTAWRGDTCVGRISASIDRGHLDRHKDDTGFWGFLDTIDDPEVSSALIARAEEWLRKKGMKRARGPVSLNINEETGCLVEGFEHPPVLLNPHHRPYQASLIEKAGYTKVKDLYGWKYVVADLNARVKKARDDIRAMPEVTARMLAPKDMEKDVATITDVFNDAWSDNWGFVPLTRSEVAKMAADFKLIAVPEITQIVFIDGEAAAVAVALPNVNELITDMHGKLFPMGLPKLLWRLKVKGATSARLLILGIRKKYRHVRKYAGLSLFLYGELSEGGRRIGIEWGELGWTLEDNGAVAAGIKMMGAKQYKTYRVFQKELS